MATTINLTVKSDFAAASADLKKFGAVTESQQKKIEEFVNSFKDETIQKFNDRLTRTVAAVKATDGPIAALRKEKSMLRTEIQKLIRNGLDPESDQIKELTTRYQKLEKEIESTNKAQKKAEASMKRTEGAMLAIGAGAVVMGKRAVDAFIDFSRESAQAASDAEEIQGKFNVVFRDIGKDATDAANTIAKDFDLANSTVNKLLGDTGDILTGLGFDQRTALELSESVGTLALDLASFTNFAGGAEGASAALTKALLGEAESAKALGIVIRQDTVEYKEMVAQIMESEKVGLVQAKALAALQIATEQSKNAIGDYARTAESAANVQRTLDEQIKRSKESWGEYLNEAITPVRAALRGFLKEVNDLKEENQAVNDSFKGSTQNIELAISGQRKLLETQKEAIKTASSYGAINEEDAKRNIELTQQRIEQLVRVKASMDSAAQAEQSALSASEKAEKEKLERQALEIEALAEIEKIRISGLSSSEKEIEAIENQIRKWRDYEGIASVNKLLNELISKRTELINEQGEKVETQLTAEQIAADERLRMILMEEEAILARDERIKQSAKDREQAEKDASDEASQNALENAQKIKDSYIDIAKNGLGAMLQGFNDIGKALVEGSLDWKTFAKVGLQALSSVLNALGAQLAAQAALAFFTPPFNIAAGIGLTAGSIAAFSASGAISAAAGTFQTGTGEPFTVPESTSSSRADTQRIAVSPGEQISVTPRGESGRGNVIVNNFLDKQLLYSVMNEGIESGEVNITTENIQGSGRATA